MLEPQMQYEKPLNYTPTNVIYWEETSKELRREGRFGISLLNKARKFLQNNCIEQTSNTSWICKPIKEYNKKTYEITSTENKFQCTCQGYKKKFKEYSEGDSNILPICSHALATIQFCFIQAKSQ